jgi:RNA polymerase sigma-70 factor (ECF subfamily)
VTERTNEQWLADLGGPAEVEALALDDLGRWLRQRLFYYLRGRSDLGGLEDQEIAAMADDFAQEALLQIRANLDQFAGRSKFTTWASKVAVNAALAELRRARWRDFSLDDLLGDAEFTPAFLVQDLGPGSPDVSAVRAEALDAVAAAINEELTPRQRAALIALTVQGVPPDVVADQLDTNPNALYKLLHDARKRLRARLAARGYNVDELLGLFGR